MSERQHEEKPEVYALRKETDGWQISRRDFLKAAGAGAAAAGILLRSGSVRAEEDLEALCKDAPASESRMLNMMASPDGRYLLLRKENRYGRSLELRNFDTQELVAKESLTGSDYSPVGFLTLNGETFLAVSSYVETSFRSIPSLNLTFTVNKPMNGFAAGTANDFYWWESSNKNYQVWHAVLKSDVSEIESFDDFDTEIVLETDKEPQSLIPLDGGKKLLVNSTREKDLDVYDLDTRKKVISKDFKNYPYVIAVLPGETKVLSISGDKNSTVEQGDTLYLHSLVDGKKLWQLDADGLSFTNAAVLPDGMTAVLSCLPTTCKNLYWISLEDGSLLHTIPAPGGAAKLAVKHDGTQIAAATEYRLWFYSLPDWKVIGCPIDLDDIKHDEKGITVEKTDPVSGQTITYTLPCGAEIPAGAVCTCNCVSGTGCSCVGYVANPCSCNNHRSGGSSYSGSHYWHPN